jgi:hypothetical protein
MGVLDISYKLAPFSKPSLQYSDPRPLLAGKKSRFYEKRLKK